MDASKIASSRGVPHGFRLKRASSDDGDYLKKAAARMRNSYGNFPVTTSVRAYCRNTFTLMNCFAAIVESFGQALRRLKYMDASVPLAD